MGAAVATESSRRSSCGTIGADVGRASDGADVVDPGTAGDAAAGVGPSGGPEPALLVATGGAGPGAPLFTGAGLPGGALKNAAGWVTGLLKPGTSKIRRGVAPDSTSRDAESAGFAADDELSAGTGSFGTLANTDPRIAGPSGSGSRVGAPQFGQR